VSGLPSAGGATSPAIGVPVARILGIEVRVQLGWVIVLALIGYIAVTSLEIVQPGIDRGLEWVLGGVVAIGFFLSSMAHDLGHAIVARRRGMPISAIVVTFFGGATPLDPSAPNARDDLAIAVSGPLASIVIGAVLAALTAVAAAAGPGLETAAAVLGVLAILNFILGVVNLVPAYPLDGGRIIRGIGWRRGGSMRAGWQAAARSGRLTGFGAIGVGVAVMIGGEYQNGAMIAVSGWFLILSGRSIAERLRVDDLIGGLHVEDAMETSPVSIGPSLTVDTFAGQLLDDESPMTAVPVVADDEVVGVLGIRDVKRLQRSRWPTTRVEDVMAKPPRLTMLAARDSLGSAVERLQHAGLDGLPVVEGKNLVGMLTRRSVGKLLHERGLLRREGRPVA
jgi:Zn-dependent protease/CBS domain-containing protein